MGISIFWYDGEVDDVTGRLCAAALHYDADICLLISGDCPLIDYSAIDTMLDEFIKHPAADTIVLPPLNKTQSCMLQGVNIARRTAWQKADKISTTPPLREHFFPVFSMQPELFNHLPITIDTSFYAPFHRLSIDTWADYHFFTQVAACLSEDNRDFSLKNVISLLQYHPEIKAINAHVHQRKVYEVLPKITYVSFFTGVDQQIYSDQRLFDINLGLYIMEKTSWPVSYIIDNYGSSTIFNDRGLRYTIIKDQRDIPVEAENSSVSMHYIINNIEKFFSDEQLATIYPRVSSLTVLTTGASISDNHHFEIRVPQIIDHSNSIDYEVADKIIGKISPN